VVLKSLYYYCYNSIVYYIIVRLPNWRGKLPKAIDIIIILEEISPSSLEKRVLPFNNGCRKPTWKEKWGGSIVSNL
jgi:hypothetical protein